ncbi:MAG: putative bifunctional diguanylate cyclase/phosphodiesterase [Xenococcaceae cyanobacterium]
MHKGTIVCIDDERLVLISLRDQLNRLLGGDYEIELAEGCEDALALFDELAQARIEIPLVICDQLMPGMTGEELLIDIHTRHPQTRKILLTGQASFDALIGAINRANLYRYIAKPWDETDLGLTVKEAIHSYFQTQQLLEQNSILQKINQELKSEIQRRERMEQQLIHEALHDALTGLPNRTLFMERLEKALQMSKRYEDYLFAILFIDLDRFKVINDSLGHHIGDRLLIEFASRLKAITRATDTSARLSGDEFVILLEPISALDDAIRTAQRIARELNIPLHINGREVSTNASIGIAMNSSEYNKGAELLRDADIAMYRAKEKGKGRYEVFNRVMYARAIERLHLENDLRQALDRQELLVYYQPIVSATTGKLKGFEALLRWKHPVRGFVSPAEFIPIAEETGAIVPIGEWLLRSVCQQIDLWQTQLSMNSPLQVSVNLSARQLKESQLSTTIDEILAQFNLKGENLQLELTESMLMEDIEEIIVILWKLRQKGIQLSIDDFGTGYSSLSYLHRLPANYLKIDRSFVTDICSNSDSQKITEVIITLANSLNMKTIAEGVETQQQLECLRFLNCDFIQGYLFSPPVPPSEAIQVCSKLNCL